MDTAVQDTNGRGLPRPDVSPLRAIVRMTIVNNDTKDVILTARSQSPSIREELYGYVEYSEWDPGFYAILGTPNGASTL